MGVWISKDFQKKKCMKVQLNGVLYTWKQLMYIKDTKNKDKGVSYNCSLCLKQIYLYIKNMIRYYDVIILLIIIK